MGGAWFPAVEAVERSQLPFRTSSRQGWRLQPRGITWDKLWKDGEGCERPVTVSRGSKAKQDPWVSFKNQAMEGVEKRAGKA